MMLILFVLKISTLTLASGKILRLAAACFYTHVVIQVFFNIFKNQEVLSSKRSIFSKGGAIKRGAIYLLFSTGKIFFQQTFQQKICCVLIT